MLYLRHSSLVLGHLTKHPEAKDTESKAALRPLLKRMPVVIKQLEELKPHVDNAYDEWLKVRAAQRDVESKKATSTYQKHAATDPALSWNTTSRSRVLDAGQHQELAVDLAKREIHRRETARRASRQAGVPDEEEQVRRSGGLWDDWETGSSTRTTLEPKISEEQELRKQMEAARRMAGPSVDLGGRDERTHNRQGSGSRTHSQTYRYPSISKSTPLHYDSHSLDTSDAPSRLPPPRPSKESIPQPQPYHYDSAPPTIPRKDVSEPPPYAESYHEDIPELPPKTVEAPTKKERLTFKPAAYLENGKPIRPVFLPDKLRQTFLDYASDNTRKGLEMCGILCGNQVNNALFISCLLIPEQKCTSDTCETENETAMLDFCINQDLLMLGWIHTHPTQTCFMSSRDLHTQAGYQVMMPESIAIVCAPTHTPS